MDRRFWTQFGPYLGLTFALAATLGSLYYSEIAGFVPCTLCWYQRILMYPLVIISLVGILRQDEGLPLWIALDGGRVVGQTGAMVEPIKFGDVKDKVAWSVDTYVLPEYRGRGVGRQLQQANQSHHRLFMSLAMSQGNRRIKTRLGGMEPL